MLSIFWFLLAKFCSQKFIIKALLQLNIISTIVFSVEIIGEIKMET